MAKMTKLTIAEDEQLRQLIEQQTPSWCTKDLYDKLVELKLVNRRNEF